MEQRLSMITLGVASLERAVTFYEQVLGWKAVPITSVLRRTGAFFNLGGVVFSLYSHNDLAQDMNVGKWGPRVSYGAPFPMIYKSHSITTGETHPDFALVHNVRSKEEVDLIFSRLKDNGVTIVKEPKEVIWTGGYSGYFSDPDGHSWEIVYNPGWTI